MHFHTDIYTIIKDSAVTTIQILQFLVFDLAGEGEGIKWFILIMLIND